MTICLMLLACKDPKEGKLLISAPDLKGEVVTLQYVSRVKKENINQEGLLELDVQDLMQSTRIKIGERVSFDCYLPREGGEIVIDSSMNIHFIGDFKEINDFIQESKFNKFDGRMFKKDFDDFSEYLTNLKSENLKILRSIEFLDGRYAKMKEVEINYEVDMIRLVYLISEEDEKLKMDFLKEQLEGLDIDKSKIICDSYVYYLFRLCKELSLMECQDDALIPFEKMRLSLDYAFKLFEDKEIRELIIHKIAMDYIFQQGNDPVLDEVYNECVSDLLLKEQYLKLSERWSGLWTGQYFNPMDFTDMEGNSLDLESNKGKYVLYHVWATWCRPCVHELSIALDLEKSFLHASPFEYVTLSVDKNRRRWESYVKEHGMNEQSSYNSISYEEVGKEYAITTISRFFLCDQEGKLLSANFYMPSDPEFKKVLSRILKISKK